MWCRAGGPSSVAVLNPLEEPSPVDLAVALTAFAVIFPAEMPDKTALASLVLGSRYRPGYVFAGVAAAFAMHAVLAVAAGSLLGLLPRRPLEAAVAVLFVVGAIVLLRGRRHDEDEHTELGEKANRFWPVALTSFAVVAVAEFGDLTQIAIATLAARYHAPLAVGTGSVLALWAVAGVAIAGGRGLQKLVPLRWITRVAAGIMLILAGVSVAAAVQ